MARLFEHDDAEAMARAAAQAVTARLAGALSARGAASLSLCGGATPRRTYELLANADVAWDRVTVTLSDERWVPPDSEDSNERLVRETLLRGAGAAARFVPLYTGGDVEAAPAAIEERLAAAPRPIDVGILGIGEDGHTASLFPGETTALNADPADRVVAVAHKGPGASRARITMTLPELAAHRTLIFLAQGMKKHAIIQAVLGIAGDPQDLPVAHVIAADAAEADIYWAP